MRSRKKKNLETRLGKCNNVIFLNDGEKDFRQKCESYLNFEEIFNNSNPLKLEIGCGKGQFVCQKAKQEPNVNFIAIEKCANVIVQACEAAQRENLKNIIFLCMDAEYILRYIKEGTVTEMFLNFSCPFPKKGQATHRLSDIHFLEMYKKLMCNGAKLHQKTDNMHLFEYSLEQYSIAKMRIENLTFDLHSTDCKNNIVTEYENKFVSQGLPIYSVTAYFE